MGYYTEHNLSLVNDTTQNEFDIIKEFRKSSDNAKHALSEEGYCENSCKWYNCEKDLKEFSMKYPNIIFLLEGKGEDSEDMWRLYVKEGHSQRCKAEVVFPEFDEGKLLADIRDSKIETILK